MILDRLDVAAADLAAATGWKVEPQGLCQGDVCIPLPPDAVEDGVVDVAVVAARAGMPLVHDAARGLWALGPRGGGPVLASADVPDITLPDVDGNPFRLRALHGRRSLVVAWASW